MVWALPSLLKQEATRLANSSLRDIAMHRTTRLVRDPTRSLTTATTAGVPNLTPPEVETLSLKVLDSNGTPGDISMIPIL